jgi:hypothetical protein
MRTLIAVAVIAGTAFLIDQQYNNGRYRDALSSMLRQMSHSFRVR